MSETVVEIMAKAAFDATARRNRGQREPIRWDELYEFERGPWLDDARAELAELERAGCVVVLRGTKR